MRVTAFPREWRPFILRYGVMFLLCFSRCFTFLGPKPYLLFSDHKDIRRVSYDGSEINAVVGEQRIRSAHALSFDVKESKVYWSDISGKMIQRASITPGSEVETVIDSGIKKVFGLAVDWIGRKLYWSEEGTYGTAPL